MNRLWFKLTLAFLAIALVAVGVVALLSARITGDQFRQYIVHTNMMAQPQVAESLIAYYAAKGSWDGVDALVADLEQSSMGMGMGAMGRGRGFGLGQNLTLADVTGRVVYDRSGQLQGQRLSATALREGVPLTLPDGQQIGTLLSVQTADVALDAQGQAFLDRVRWSLVWAGLAATGLALALGLLVSWRLTAPLGRLTNAAHGIAQGNLGQRVSVAGGDEIGELGDTFNQMAANLQQAETLRRNLMADIAHELRTPLTVIQGNLQAMLDGIYPLDQAQVASLHDETRLLTRLVDDLRELALAEAGHLRLERAPVDLVTLARTTAANFAPAAETAGVELTVEAAPDAPEITGDADRLGQVLRNLLSNALRHTPAGKRIIVRVGRSGDQVFCVVEDTGAGIAPEDLPHVFDRFYRGDKSRSRRSGGTGLGLAIARQLVLAHGGKIEVESSVGQGTTFTVSLPISA